MDISNLLASSFQPNEIIGNGLTTTYHLVYTNNDDATKLNHNFGCYSMHEKLPIQR